MADPLEEQEALKAQLAALTARVQALEQKAEIGSAVPQAKTSTDAPPPPPIRVNLSPSATTRLPMSSHVTPPPFATSPPVFTAAEVVGLEKKIGQYWLNRVGIVAVLCSVAYFLKYAFANNWIGPAGRVTIGLLAGIAVILWSERFRNRGHLHFSYSLKAIGVGTLYLSLWGAFQVYHLVPSAAAFAAMVVVTAATIVLALRQDAELLAAFALLGGFSTPVLLSTGENHEVVLFSYVCLLDLAILTMAAAKSWRRLLWGSFAGTLFLYVGWASAYYSTEQRPVTILFVLLFAAIFAASPVTVPFGKSSRSLGPSSTLTILPVGNAVALFLQLYAMYADEKALLTWFALGLAAFYLGLSNAFSWRFPGQDKANAAKILRLLHVAIAIVLITIAVPLKLNGHWITIGWLIESGVLLWVGVKMQVVLLRTLAICALGLGILRLLAWHEFHVQTLIFNERFGTYLVAIAVLGVFVALLSEYPSDEGWFVAAAASVALNFFALVAMTWEATDYFGRHADFSSGLRRDFSYSAIWLSYGALLMAVGFWKRIPLVRWQALALIAFAIAKVFLYDVRGLEGVYRIFSFLGLGVVLLAISFAYQRDWLKLSLPSSEKSPQEESL